MKEAHTDGPWTFDNHSPAIPMLGVYAPDGKGPWHHDRSDEEKEANSRLAAAAPDLLEACRKALYALKGREHDGFLRDAIEKATGERP